ncbi:hypothetical protein KEM55_000886 [Ascosphaera atra]|nr:hypothetical protein KEM55_000886 [Ascosphaera atra]
MTPSLRPIRGAPRFGNGGGEARAMDIDARSSMERVVEEVATTVANGSKLVICGVGKSGKIGQKIVATMNSLGVHSSFLHPTEALHGDLGMIRPDDTVLVISYSGKTKELLHLLPHIPRQAVLVAMTQHMNPADCPILTSATNHTKILLPSPIHRSEEDCFGVSAPTTSTTVALALGDALSLAAARRIYDIQGKRPQDVFRAHHPGGAIGAAYADSIARQQQQQQPQPQPQLQPNAYRSPVSEAEPSLSPTAIMSSVLSSDNDENLPQDLTCRDLLSNPLV